ncbi:hypothetical protein [Candidatus Nitrospira bockiana]
MPKHILFLIHGIGLHEPVWGEELDGPIKTLEAISAEYGYFKKPGQALHDKVEFVTVHYDEVFQEIIAKWRQDASAIAQFDQDRVLQGSLDWLVNASDETFWWSHVADLAMYRFFPLYRQRVRSHVILQLAQRIEQEMNHEGSATCSVLAHSMGTAVAHDCLHLLGTVRWGKKANPLNPAHWRFQHLFMMANTSRLLQTEDAEMKKAYESIVRPGPVEDASSYLATYWNIRHEADPVPFPKMFDPVGWKDYTSILIQHFYEVNVHNLSHYLRHPRVHIPLFNKVVSRKVVSKEEEIHAVDQFPQFGGELAVVQKAKDLASKLSALKSSLGEDPGPKEWLGTLMEFYRAMEAAR